jgi:hypothetical protein
LMATAFHPELTRDDRLHRYFVRIALEHKAWSVNFSVTSIWKFLCLCNCRIWHFVSHL